MDRVGISRERVWALLRLCSLTLALALGLVCSGCMTGAPATFATSTYYDESRYTDPAALGRVVGRSCQTRILYVLPKGPATSTSAAIEDAKSKMEGTVFLADVSVEERLEWRFGYSRNCVIVTAIAYTAEEVTP